MIHFFNTQFEALSIHKIGNQHKNEGLLLSNEPHVLDDELNGHLKEFFFKPFREKEEVYYHFTHEVDLEFHPLYQVISQVFNKTTSFHQASCDIAKHLYDQSKHPHIKSGELYVTQLQGVVYNNQKINALGIFKSELKQDFLQVEGTQTMPELRIKQGINLNKLDKGCIVLELEQESGFRIMSIDTNRYDSKYWLEAFLGVSLMEDGHFFTKNYLKFCQGFAKEVVFPAEDKQQEVLFMNKAVHHFAKNDHFNESAFIEEVIDNPALIPEFKHYKVERGPKYNLEDVAEFDIANKAVTESRKKIRNVIQLDTNIQIKLDFVNPESAQKFVEKGWDEERQMYYYLVYFNREQGGN